MNLANTSKPNLNEVTICAADCLTPELALMAIEKSMEQCDFGEAILFTDKSIDHKKDIKLVTIKRLNSQNDYSRFILKELHKHIETKFILIVQWDGYVLSGKNWHDRFYNYDLIGAKWHWHKDAYTVGNGGFTLRSLKLQKIMASNTFPFIEKVGEDAQICKIYREKLMKQYKIKFASEEVADEFSYERRPLHTNTFGFHGFFNFYRHAYDDDLKKIIKHLNSKIFITKEFRELLIQYVVHMKLKSSLILYKIFTKHVSFKNRLKFFFHVTKRIFLHIFNKKYTEQKYD
jgi:hypothetical protein